MSLETPGAVHLSFDDGHFTYEVRSKEDNSLVVEYLSSPISEVTYWGMEVTGREENNSIGWRLTVSFSNGTQKVLTLASTAAVYSSYLSKIKEMASVDLRDRPAKLFG